MTKKADIGLIGLAVMGENLVLNMERNGFTVAVFNRHTEKVDAFVNGRGKGKNFIGCHSIEELCANLASPRKIMLMVKAGQAVDDLTAKLLPYLDKGDIMLKPSGKPALLNVNTETESPAVLRSIALPAAAENPGMLTASS